FELIVLSTIAGCIVLALVARLISNVVGEKFAFGELAPGVLHKISSISETKEFHPVYYTSPDRFKNPIKVIPWNAFGVLVVTKGHFWFIGQDRSNRIKEIKLPRQESGIRFVSRN